MQNAIRAIEAFKIDNSFRREVEFAATPEEKVAIANAAGFDFTLEDFKKAMEQLLEKDLLEPVYRLW